MTRRLRPALAALLLAGSLAVPLAAATPAAAAPADPICDQSESSIAGFYGILYKACLWATSNTFTAKIYAVKSGSAYDYSGVKLSIRIRSNGERITGDVCAVAITTTSWKSCTVQTPRGHTGNLVDAVGWVAFDGRCGSSPSTCIGYRSAYADGWVFTDPQIRS